jgi:hypothetical protein
LFFSCNRFIDLNVTSWGLFRDKRFDKDLSGLAAEAAAFGDLEEIVLDGLERKRKGKGRMELTELP